MGIETRKQKCQMKGEYRKNFYLEGTQNKEELGRVNLLMQTLSTCNDSF